ncbi:uncharacterized protein LOC128549655 [Mercenaria mercenaria]|uniref:uncharacterized protein LOC128549655 n=1 Tax=Mercenaria mercenaria TaxID=6596 RepID=UPI00234F71C1|nr:uncharacterized protein LOC128549655 [Mercenaria mercenaria]
MASNGNERYLRYILLLGEGVLLVLRGIVQREVHRTGLTLDAILTIPNNRGQIESNCHSETQRLHLFPSTSTVNSDIETWDISLLTLVIQRVFWSNLSRDERVRISYLRDSRNEYQGHPPQMSMEDTEYTTRAADLTTILQDLASGMDQQTRDKLTRIINDSNAVQFDFHTAIQNLQHLYEFREDMLRELETKFHDVNTKLDTIQDESSDHKKMTRDMGTLQGHMHDDLLDIKSLAEENNRTATSLSKTLDNVKETVSSSRERDEQQQETLRHIEQMMTELMSHQGDRHLQHDIDANININSERPENANEAQDIIVTNINDILKEIRPDAMEDRDLAEGITQRVNELITRYEGSDYELTKALLELIKDIIRHGHIQQVKKGSIKLTVRFTSYRGLQSFVQYLNSEQFQDRLNDISRALKNRTGHVVTLSAYIAQESLYDLLRHLEEECKSLKCTRSVVLPVQCKGIMDLNHIWKLLQTGGADRHMDRLSEILTKIVGRKVTLTTSVDLKQFELALIETEKSFKMATAENEYYIRAILLLVEGGSYISKKILYREHFGDLDKSLKRLERELKHEFHEKQIDKLFPQTGNTMVDTWDLQMLIKVVLRLFHNSLKREDIRNLRVLKWLWNEVQAHSPSVTLDAVQYEDINDQLTDALTSLAAGFEKNVQQECRSIINKYTSGPLDVMSSRECLKQLQNNAVLVKEILEKIESSKDDICTRLDATQKSLPDDAKNIRQHMTDVENTLIEQLQKLDVGTCRKKIKVGTHEEVSLGGPTEEWIQLMKRSLNDVLSKADKTSGGTFEDIKKRVEELLEDIKQIDSTISVEAQC